MRTTWSTPVSPTRIRSAAGGEDPQNFCGALLTFLASRALLTGAGHVISGESGPRFGLSQRADFIVLDYGDYPCHGIVSASRESYAGDGYERLHVTVGDSNMSETTTLLKVVSTLLVLEMLEAGIDLSHLAAVDPVRMLKLLDTDHTGRTPVLMRNGKTRPC